MRNYKRNKNGQFAQDRTLYKWFLIYCVVGSLVVFTVVGINNVVNWFWGIEKVFVVEGTQAVEYVTPTLRDEVRQMLKNGGIVHVEAAMKIAEYESWFKEDNFHVNKDGSIDRGLWMINNKYHPEVSDECAYDGICSTIQAIRIMKERGFMEWVCWSKHLCR